MNPPIPPLSGPDESAEQLIANISKLMAEAEEMLSESTSQHAEEKVELLRARHESAKQRLADRYAEIKAKLAAGAARTDAFIRANPYETAAIALGVGLLLGACCSRRRA